MLKLHTLAEWMHGFLDPERPYGLPEDVYNDVIPSPGFGAGEERVSLWRNKSAALPPRWHPGFS